MTASPIDRLLSALLMRQAAVEAGHLPGPPPPVPQKLARLAIEQDPDSGEWVLMAVTRDGWQVQTELRPGECVELLPPARPLSELLH